MHPVLWKKKKDLMDFIQAKCSSLNLCKCSLTSSHGLVFHSGHSFRLHRIVACGFVISLQLKSLSLHSTDRILIPEPQLTEHYKRNNQQWWKRKILHKKERQKLTKTGFLSGTINEVKMMSYFAPVSCYPCWTGSDVAIFSRRRFVFLVTSGT